MFNLDDLLNQQTSSKKPQVAEENEEEKLKDKLSEIRIKEKEEEASQKAYQSGVPYINLTGFPISPEAISLISSQDAMNYKIICFYRTDREAKIASYQAEDENLAKFREKIEGAFDLKTELFLVSENSFNLAYKLYSTLPKITPSIKGVKITAEDIENFKSKIKTVKDLNHEIQKVNISELVTLVVASAISSRASDIHIEAEEHDVKIRFRIDGVLIDAAEIDKKLWEKIISRIKLLSSLKINITDQPQDGRFTIDLVKDKVDVRVSCLPTAYGESVVMRLLRSSVAELSFENLGLRDSAFELLKKEVERPNGMIVTTGPTGSGKTTTLYAVLNKLNNPGTKIITLEDPVEYHLKGINQSQIDITKDYTFAKGLRSILRQDPDVVMVGEIRDLETAEIAIQAALTGHLVISTLHTNDAAGAIPRFFALGVKPYLLTPAINAIIGQRLVRKICQKCREEITLEPTVLERVKKILSELPQEEKKKINFPEDINQPWTPKFYQSKGCPECQGLGYFGRLGIYEIFTMNPAIEESISKGEISEYKIKELAQKQGMVTMVQDGLLKALDGITSVEEVFRVIE
ncbi:MAG: GspE/PulE family protein [Patescibacteria group bacterium]|nr:GspE/PulE family protein [Patescibacteria group bacterium]MDD5164597.1 GspE/PulE family protein [Patescibacteria group bacterium]MDD5534352.1 GspE/PulE family protein [Patescibacteria group bacterium]